MIDDNMRYFRLILTLDANVDANVLHPRSCHTLGISFLTLKHNAEVMRSKANRLKGYLPLVHVRSLDCSTFAFVLTHFLTSGFFDAREKFLRSSDRK